MSAPKRFVYILKSLAKPDTYYVGLTSDVPRRLETHNEGLSVHTSEHRPWRTLVVIEFDEEAPALKFERYPKTGSGREFARRHFRRSAPTEPGSTDSAASSGLFWPAHTACRRAVRALRKQPEWTMTVTRHSPAVG